MWITQNLRNKKSKTVFMEEENKNFLKKLYSLKDVPIKLSGVQKFALFVFVTNLIVLLDVPFNLFHHNYGWGFYFPTFVGGLFNTLILALFFSVFVLLYSFEKIYKKESFINIYLITYGLTILSQSVLAIYGFSQKFFLWVVISFGIAFALSTAFFGISILIAWIFKKLP